MVFKFRVVSHLLGFRVVQGCSGVVGFVVI